MPINRRDFTKILPFSALLSGNFLSSCAAATYPKTNTPISDSLLSNLNQKDIEKLYKEAIVM